MLLQFKPMRSCEPPKPLHPTPPAAATEHERKSQINVVDASYSLRSSNELTFCISQAKWVIEKQRNECQAHARVEKIEQNT